jgi:O-antigen ligase
VLHALSNANEFADRAHNVVLDTLLCFGLAGVLMLVVFAQALLRARRFDIGVVLLASIVTLQFSFALHAELALLACLVAPAIAVDRMPEMPIPHRVRLSIPWVALALASFLPLQSLSSTHWRRVDYAYLAFARGQASYRMHDLPGAAQAFERAAVFDPLREDYARAHRQTEQELLR